MKLRDSKIIVAVMSCHAYRDSRQIAVRDSWVRALNDRWFFFEGGDEESYNEENNILILNCPDAYEDLALKTKLMLKFVFSNFEFDYLIKVDDDTGVVVDRLLNTDLPKEDYMGYPVGLKSYTGGIQYAQGGGYILSRHATSIIVDYEFDSDKSVPWWYGGQASVDMWKADEEVKKVASVEDLMVGDILSKSGISIYNINYHVKNYYPMYSEGGKFRAMKSFEDGDVGMFYHPVLDTNLMRRLFSG
jgi:hypothetical protein